MLNCASTSNGSVVRGCLLGTTPPHPLHCVLGFLQRPSEDQARLCSFYRGAHCSNHMVQSDSMVDGLIPTLTPVP
jgi:hypothetical protein